MRRFVLGWKKLGHEKRLAAHIVNYADDLVICCRGRAEEALARMRHIMTTLKLTVNETKWQQLFGGDPKALGATIRIDGIPLTVIGVAPPGFDYPGKAVLWKPAAFSQGNNSWVTVARLKPGVTWPQARAAFDVEVDQRSPRPAKTANLDLRPRMMSLRDGLLGPVKDATLMLMGAVVLILLIACTNVANLLLARTADRTAELSVRAALGASRVRIARQLLTECLLLSFVAALVGSLLASWTISLAAKVEPPPLGSQSYSILDEHVLAFTLMVSVMTAVLFGVLPSLYAGRTYAFGTRSGRTPRRSRFVGGTLTVAQVILTMVLLAGAISVGSAFVHLMRMDRGYHVNGIVTVNVSLVGTTHQLGRRQLPYFEDVLDGIRKLPGVRSASATELLPLDTEGFMGGPFGVDGSPAKRNSLMVLVFSDYFRTMGGRILYGREFNDSEVRSGARVAVVDERFADAFGGPGGVVGRQLTIGSISPWRIVGVVKGMNYETDPTVGSEFQVFIPSENPGFSTIVARVDGRAEDHLGAIRDTIRSEGAEVPVFGVKTMDQRLDELFARPKFYRTAVWIFAGFALLLTMIGIYGLLAYTVSRRTNEIGVRMALGATQNSVTRMVLGETFLLVSAGISAGVPLVLWTKHVATTLIGGQPPTNTTPVVFGASAILAVALFAAYFPVRRACRVDPMTALRHE
jgi:predicted permease